MKRKKSSHIEWLFKSMGDQAIENFKRDGYLLPIIHGVKKGKFVTIPFPHDSEEEKSKMMKVIAGTFAIHEIEEYIVVMETWISMDQDLREKNMEPKDDPDRQSAIFLIYKSHDKQRARSIIVDPETKSIIREQEMTNQIGAGGTFLNFLPPKGFKCPPQLEAAIHLYFKKHGIDMFQWKKMEGEADPSGLEPETK